MKELLNKHIIIDLKQTTSLGNGLSLKETRGKRDIVSGIVTLADPSVGLAVGDHIWFPLYAANEIVIDGKQYLVVNIQDVIMKDNHG